MLEKYFERIGTIKWYNKIILAFVKSYKVFDKTDDLLVELTFKEFKGKVYLMKERIVWETN